MRATMPGVLQLRERGAGISVVMPVFNEGPFIAAALQCLQRHVTTNFDLEILVIDGMKTELGHGL